MIQKTTTPQHIISCCDAWLKTEGLLPYSQFAADNRLKDQIITVLEADRAALVEALESLLLETDWVIHTAAKKHPCVKAVHKARSILARVRGHE